MFSYTLKIGFFIHLLGFVFYDYTGVGINIVSSLLGLSVYLTYTFFYKLSFIDINFAKSITPINYSQPYYGTHKLVSYGFSTMHAFFLALFANLYLLNVIDNDSIKQVYFISMSYYFADLYYVIDSTNKLTKLDYFTLCHHTVMILAYYVIFIQIDNDLNLENSLLYYMNRGILSEYSVFTLNYSWYLVNTKQENTTKMLVASLSTLVLYFITRVVNFTLLIYNFWSDDLLPAIALMMPLFLINYYWFYKLMHKGIRIYKQTKF